MPVMTEASSDVPEAVETTETTAWYDDDDVLPATCEETHEETHEEQEEWA